MFKVDEKFLDSYVVCSKFRVNFKDANQEQLEHLFHLGHPAVITDKKKVKNKQVDNLEYEEIKPEGE
jgi:hypothetical protein